MSRQRPTPPTRFARLGPWIVLGCMLVVWPAAWLTGEWTATRPDLEDSWPRVLAEQAVEVHEAWLADGEQSIPPAPAVMARRAEIVRLGGAREALSNGEGVGTAASLYVEAADPRMRSLALALLVGEAGARWPKGYRRRFLSRILGPVLDGARQWHNPASVTLAQAVLESGWGRSRLARDHHNLFGVKSGSSSMDITLVTVEYGSNGRFTTTQRFRHYDAVDASIAHHAELMATDRRYARARDLWTDWRAWLDAISPRYASDPRYARRVAWLVEHYHLDAWDSLVQEAVAHDAQR